MHRLGLVRYRHKSYVPSRKWLLAANHKRGLSVLAANSLNVDSPNHAPLDSSEQRSSFFVDGVLPVRYAKWDIRYYLSPVSAGAMASRVDNLFGPMDLYGFRVLKVEPTPKDGGVFVHFAYNPGASDTGKALSELESALRKEVSGRGGVPSWYGLGRGSFNRVKGRPWNEDMSRYPSTILKIEFEGPDVHQELLYDLLRPYGRITDMTKPQPAPAGTLRSTTVTFSRIGSAVMARNCLHGYAVSDSTLSSSGTTGAPTKTRLSFSYERPIKVHAIRDWLTSHPRIVLPIVAFLLGSITYTVFDPIRAAFVKGKVMGWFNYKEWKMYKFVRKNAIDKLTFNVQSGFIAGGAASSNATSTAENSTASEPEPEPKVTHLSGAVSAGSTEWKDRQEAEQTLLAYLAELPTTVAMVHGPQGSGKAKMIARILEEEDRKVLDLDCAEILKATSDSGLVDGLAKQTGYWPVFSFLASMNNLIDLASMGLIGQKAGFSTSVDKELKEILEVVGGALKQVSEDLKKDEKAKAQRAERNRRMAEQPIRAQNKGEKGEAAVPMPVPPPGMSEEDIDTLPIVVIRNFAIKSAGSREVLLNVLADWAAALVDNQVAHVVVLTDNRENMRRLAKALPARPLASIALADADSASALSFVQGKMTSLAAAQFQSPPELSSEDVAEIEKLGGRASDLDTLIHKIRNGASIKDAVQDIVARGVGELRKTAFGDDVEDAKNLLWTREQAWGVIRQLAKEEEIPYAQILLEFPFKGDEAALRGMEHAELITIATHEGMPIAIKPGKPVYRYVFQRLVGESVFFAVQDINYNQKAIAAEEKTIKACEEELVTLRTIGLDTGSTLFSFSTGAAASRASYLLSKMKSSEEKLEELERKNKALMKVLSTSARV